MNQLSLFARPKQCLAPGAVHVPDWLSLQEQRPLDLCRSWARPPSGLYTPRMPDGKPLSCVLWAWGGIGIPTSTLEPVMIAIAIPVSLFQQHDQSWHF